MGTENIWENWLVSPLSQKLLVEEKDWFDKVGPANPDEEDMLDLAVDLQPTSRLGCQIEVTPELDGLIVNIPNE